MTLLDRVAAKIDARGDCWIWTASTDRHGYGRVRVGGRHSSAHRYVYESLVGPIPDGLELDHLCKVRSCVNPDHLEPVTRRENVRRGARYRRGTCRKCGDRLTRRRDRSQPSGYQWHCQPCHNAYQREWRASR